MEYGLGPAMATVLTGEQSVLILVLMEYGLGHADGNLDGTGGHSLNPCFNGIWSRTNVLTLNAVAQICLNPCFNGIWSRTQTKSYRYESIYQRLNPCFNGIWSRTQSWRYR